MSHLRRLDCIGFVWFYRDVAPDGAWLRDNVIVLVGWMFSIFKGLRC